MACILEAPTGRSDAARFSTSLSWARSAGSSLVARNAHALSGIPPTPSAVRCCSLFGASARAFRDGACHAASKAIVGLEVGKASERNNRAWFVPEGLGIGRMVWVPFGWFSFDTVLDADDPGPLGGSPNRAFRRGFASARDGRRSLASARRKRCSRCRRASPAHGRLNHARLLRSCAPSRSIARRASDGRAIRHASR